MAKWKNKAFVGMWFDEKNVIEKFDEIIKIAVKRSGIEPYFLKELITGDSIPIDIMSGIIECKLTIFDISPMTFQNGKPIRNPNVMYELGLAHTWRNREEVIILSDNLDNLPFDVQPYGVIKYDSTNKEESIEKIKETILFRLDEIDKIQRSVVRKSAESLNAQAHSVLMSSRGKIFHEASLKDTEKILAIPVLLSLGLVELLADKGGYGYHPTQVGREVIKYHGYHVDDDDIKNYITLYKPDY
jgi:hypothetical protein